MSTTVETSEKAFQGAVIQFANIRQWRVAHFSDSRRQIRPGVFVGDTLSKGFPDLTLVRDRLLFAELKAEKGNVKKEQREWVEVLKAAGQEVYVWRPRDWAEIESVLA